MIMAFLSTLFLSMQSLAIKGFEQKFSRKIAGVVLMNAAAMAFISLLSVLMGAAEFIVWPAMGLALCFGMVFVMTVLLMLLSFESGPLGISSLIINSSLLISVLGGILIWKEEISGQKMLGIALILVMFVMSGLDFGSKGCVKKKSWIYMVFGAFMGNGILSLIQKKISVSYAEIPALTFNFWAYFFAAVICMAIVVSLWLKGERFLLYREGAKSFWICSLCVGIGSMFGAFFMLNALSNLPAVVVYPITQGGQVLACWLAGSSIYKEKLRAYDVLRMLIGLPGILLLCMA